MNASRSAGSGWSAFFGGISPAAHAVVDPHPDARTFAGSSGLNGSAVRSSRPAFSSASWQEVQWASTNGARSSPRTAVQRRPPTGPARGGATRCAWTGCPVRRRDARRRSGDLRRDVVTGPVKTQTILDARNRNTLPAAFDPAGDRLEPEPGLVLGPHLDRLARVRRPQPPHPPPQVFFHRRRVGGSADRGWDGRGTCNVNPRGSGRSLEILSTNRCTGLAWTARITSVRTVSPWPGQPPDRHLHARTGDRR